RLAGWSSSSTRTSTGAEESSSEIPGTPSSGDGAAGAAGGVSASGAAAAVDMQRPRVPISTAQDSAARRRSGRSGTGTPGGDSRHRRAQLKEDSADFQLIVIPRRSRSGDGAARGHGGRDLGGPTARRGPRRGV